MLGLSIKKYPAGALLRPHTHQHSQLCMLLRGSMIQWSVGESEQLTSAQYRCGDIWFVEKTTVHSASVLADTSLLRLKLCLPSRRNFRIVGAASLALLSIHAARACEYNLADLERDKASGMRVDVPDCFFEELESAAAGGDAQAQLELGISFIEGYSSNAEDVTLGPYWIKKAIRQGHPSAKNILDSYMEDYAC